MFCVKYPLSSLLWRSETLGFLNAGVLLLSPITQEHWAAPHSCEHSPCVPRYGDTTFWMRDSSFRYSSLAPLDSWTPCKMWWWHIYKFHLDFIPFEILITVILVETHKACDSCLSQYDTTAEITNDPSWSHDVIISGFSSWQYGWIFHMI